MTFQVTIKDQSTTFTVEDGESVLDAALRQGITLAYGCRNGNCGACAGTVLEGGVSYPGRLPKAIKNKSVAADKTLFCSASPLSDIVIDAQIVDEEAAMQIKTLPARVEALTRLNQDVMLLELKLPAAERMQFLAGQYIEILLRDGRRRSFSIANAPHDDALLSLHIREVPDGYFTHFVFHELEQRAMLRIEGPHGAFYLREDSSNPIIMVAGGTGFGPCKGMIEHAIFAGIDRPIELYWGVRSANDLYMRELAEKWAKENENIRFIPVLSEPEERDQWTGETGWVHENVIKDHGDLSGYDVYMCGPPPMIDAGKAAFFKIGLTDEKLFFDSFEFSENVAEKAPVAEDIPPHLANPIVVQKKPYVVDLEPGTTYWCSCGRSESQPFCDGKHQGTSFEPVAFTVKEKKKYGLCGCKHTKNLPFCDGSHRDL